MDRREAVDELKVVFTVLANDLETARALVKANPTQFAQRTFVRTYFAFVEGLAFQLRQVTLASLGDTDLLTPGELALLREERYQLNKQGVPEARENFQSVLPNLLFAIRCYVKNHGASYEPDTGQHGWESMRRATALRDRITHPKSARGLELTDEDTKALNSAALWWKNTLLAMFQACGEADEFFRARQQEQ